MAPLAPLRVKLIESLSLSIYTMEEDFKPTPEEIDQDFKAMNDSVWVIENLVDLGPREDQTQKECNEEITRNVDHLEIMLTKPYIIEDGRPLDTYNDAIVNGKAYVAAHPVDSASVAK